MYERAGRDDPITGAIRRDHHCIHVRFQEVGVVGKALDAGMPHAYVVETIRALVSYCDQLGAGSQRPFLRRAAPILRDRDAR